MDPIRINDRMVTNDDLIITNKINTECAAPHGRLFQVLGVENGRRVVKEIACNTVVVGGAITALENLTGASANWKPSSLNDIYGVSASSTATPKLALFGIGIGGSSLEFGSVTEPDIKQRDVINPIPLRYGEALTGDDAAKYFMKVASDGANKSWYLKQFSSVPVIKTCWKNSTNTDEDGTEINNEIYNINNPQPIETFTELQIDMNTSDGREYFVANGNISEARYNTFGFYTGSPTADGKEYANEIYWKIFYNIDEYVDFNTKQNERKRPY